MRRLRAARLLPFLALMVALPWTPRRLHATLDHDTSKTASRTD